ncbi:sorbitol dehydrogenase-like [Neocloeon triangulifer]|uniref:sorbitol dehydrogenase-like n=1 Tax=Neocloeon triangulifer TaxID=2078957 RepID=UPI00286F9366|nr:sorbitol dehydrogenase-like [Neocloeon triangulifer]
MATANLTAVLYKANDLRLENRPVPDPKEHEVLLEMGCVGICGSDVHYFINGANGEKVVKAPIVMGHEASGTVAKVGKNVKHLKVGDRVAIEPGIPCKICDYCKQGRYNLCAEINFCSSPPCNGNLCQYYTHSADFCYRLPDHVSMEEGALLEPLSVGVHACRRADVKLGSTVLVTGAGPIGLVSMLSAKAMGATKVIITDLVQKRLDLAKSLGADHTLLLINLDEKAIVGQIHQLLGKEPDKSIECSGAESSIRIAIQSTKSGGVVVMVGVGKPNVTVPLMNALVREVDIRGVHRYANCYPLALELTASGKVDVKKLITHNFSLEETHAALETAKSGSGVKIMIHCKRKKISESAS